MLNIQRGRKRGICREYDSLQPFASEPFQPNYSGNTKGRSTVSKLSNKRCMVELVENVYSRGCCACRVSLRRPPPPEGYPEGNVFLRENWFDAQWAGVRTRVRGFIEGLLEAELDAALARKRYERPSPCETDSGAKAPEAAGHRHGHRDRRLMGTFGPVTVRVPRARPETSDGKTAEWKNATIPAYQRRTKQADALIAGAYLAGTNTRRFRRALAALFGGAVGKDTVSRVWRKVKGDWDAWNARSLAAEPIIRLILDGTVVRVRLDRRATSISLLVALGVRRDGQKVLLAVKNMGGESEAAWRTLLDDLVKRGLTTPELIIVDGAPGLEKALGALWSNAAPFINIAISSPMRQTVCTRKSPPTTPT